MCGRGRRGPSCVFAVTRPVALEAAEGVGRAVALYRRGHNIARRSLARAHADLAAGRSLAEALLATAFGLAAAIPAVVISNMFSIAQYRALYADTSVEILTMVSRDLVHPQPTGIGLACVASEP